MSNRIGSSEIILSSLFFLLAMFTLCVVVLTNTFANFSGLFVWVSEANGLYESFYLLFSIAGFVSICVVLIKERSHQRMQRGFFLFCYIMFFVFTINIFLGARPYFIQSDSADGFRVFVSTMSGRLMDCVFFIILVALPFAYYWCIDNGNLYKQFYTFPHRFVPSLNTMMVVLFGFAIQPLDKEYWWEWWEVVAAIGGVIMLGYLYYRQKFLFSSYERFNFILLMVGLIIFLISHSVFEGYASQYAAKKAIYMLAVWGVVLGIIDRYKIEYSKRHRFASF